MNAAQRRERILTRLNSAGAPLSASTLAAELGVSRQIVVGDVALLRAGGAQIDATPRGYQLHPAEKGYTGILACVHRTQEEMRRELYTVVDQGGTVVDVAVENSLYGEIRATLNLCNRYDVDNFIRQAADAPESLLSRMTGGVHLHTLRCPDKDTFARRLMDKPASYFYSVLWNKLYRREMLLAHDIRFTSEMRWAEDLVFNMQYIQYAAVFASIAQPGYYYVQNPQSICHTQINPATLVQNKIQVFRYYKDLYTRLGMYEQVRPQLYKFLVDIAESTYPSGPFKEVIDEAKAYWKDAREDVQTRTAEARERWNGMREELRETAQERSAEWKARHDSDPKE